MGLTLIIGKYLCTAIVEGYLHENQVENYICVDSPEMADWLMRDGYNCDIMIVDKTLFSSPDAASDWVIQNPQAQIIFTDQKDIHSSGFKDCFTTEISRSIFRDCIDSIKSNDGSFVPIDFHHISSITNAINIHPNGT